MIGILVIASSIVAGASPWSARNASAYNTVPGISANDYVYDLGFGPGFNVTAPVGLAFDQSGNLFIADYVYRSIFRVPPHSGPIDAQYDPSVTQANIAGPSYEPPVGLAFAGGRLYMTHQPYFSSPGDVAEVDPNTLKIVRTLSPQVPGGNGLAVDPKMGDLFLSGSGGNIYRISNFASGSGNATVYATVNSSGDNVDGIAFGPDGTLYGADNTNGIIYSFPPTTQTFSTPWIGQPVATVFVLDSNGNATAPARIDGIAVGAGGTPGNPPFLYVNRNDGVISKIDLTKTPPTQTDIVTGGTRGDFVTVDSRGCLFATQSDTVVEVTDGSGNCNPPLVPPTSGAASIALNNVNIQSDHYYDNVYTPSQPSTLSVNINGAIASAYLYVDGVQTMDVSAGGTFTWNPPRNPADGSPLYAVHTLYVQGTDRSGNQVTSQPLVLYALVQAVADGVSILPDGAVAYNPFEFDPFQAGCLNFTLPAAACVGQPPFSPPFQSNLRQDNAMKVEGKSNGTAFVEAPRAVRLNAIGQSFYCDDPAATAASRPDSVTGPFSDGSLTTYVATLETRVNATLPNVFRVATPPGITGPTNQSDFVPWIFSSIYVGVSPSGQTVVKWADQQAAHPSMGNSVFPYAYLYNDGVLVSPLPHPTPNVVAWIRTAAASPEQLLNFIEGDPLASPIAARLLKSFFHATSPDVLAQTILFQAERAECARQRFAVHYQGLTQDKEAYLQAHFPGLPIWDPLPLFLNKNILPHFNNHEFAQGIAQSGFVRDYACAIPGCPGLEHMKVVAILSPVTADVYDSAGNHTGPRADGTIEDGIASVTYFKLGQNTFMILPNDPTLRVQLSGTGNGTFTVNAADFNGTTKLGFQQYNNVVVTPSSRGSLTMGAVGTPLNWDVNGTGTTLAVPATTINAIGADDSTDTTPPTTAPILLGTSGQAGYFRSPVDLTFVGSDDLSGVAFTDYSLDGGNTWTAFPEAAIHFSQDGNYTVLFRSTDYAGNVEAAKSVSFVIDTVSPTASITSPTPGPYTLGQVQAAAYSCADSGSGIASCTGTITSGGNIDTSTVGQEGFAVTAVDRAGNQTTTGVTYTVTYGICPLYDQTKSHHIGSTIPIKLTICDSSGNDVSSSAITVRATGLAVVSSQASGPVVSDGSANPDNNFRFDSTLGTAGGYIYNLSTSGLASGTYTLSFTVSGDPTAHSVQFELQP